MNQKQMEALYSKRNNHGVLHNEIRAQLETTFAPVALQLFMRIEGYLSKEYYDSKNARITKLKESNKIEDWIVAIIAAMVHTPRVQSMQQVIGYVANHLPFEDTFEAAVTAGELIALGHKPGGLYEIVRHGQGIPATIQVNHWKFIERNLLHAFDWINDTCFNPPLIERPRKVKSNYSCGYHSIQEPCLLGTFTMHEGKINLETINQLNSIEWVLDPHVLAEQERPNKPFTSPEAHLNFIHMAQQSRKLYQMFKDRVFWLAWQADSRGRYYSHGYHINLQSTEYKKALLNFNREEVLT